MKICYKCKLSKTENCFGKNKSRRDGLQTQCKLCQKNLRREHYSKNIKQISTQVKEYRKEIRELIISLKELNPCRDCNRYYPYYVMDFDHLFDKSFNIGSRSFNCSKETLLQEIKKCDLVCANCHRERTHKRRIDILVVT